MLDPTILTKIFDFLQTSVIDSLSGLLDRLVNGELHQVEQRVAELSVEVHSRIMELLLPAAAEAFNRNHRPPLGSKSTIRPHRIRIATGHQIEVASVYYKVPPNQGDAPRRPLLTYWQTIDGFSPLLYDRVGFLAMLASSYDLAHQGLSRLRKYDGRVNENGRPMYQTPWREPKLFVIDVLDEDGRPDRHELPIYDCRFKEEDTLRLLGRYLKKLGAHRAERIQLIADGAPWIWNRVPELLASIGVQEERLTQTLDFYHAMQYVHSLVGAMPKRIGKKERKRLLNEFLGQIKMGQAILVVEKLKSIFLRLGDLVKRWIGYLEKHILRMQHADYEANGLMRGSGIVESAIRRVINLRFKNASTFWLESNFEKLYFLRVALVAGRWDIVIANLVKCI